MNVDSLFQGVIARTEGRDPSKPQSEYLQLQEGYNLPKNYITLNYIPGDFWRNPRLYVEFAAKKGAIPHVLDVDIQIHYLGKDINPTGSAIYNGYIPALVFQKKSFTVDPKISRPKSAYVARIDLIDLMMARDIKFNTNKKMKKCSYIIRFTLNKFTGGHPGESLAPAIYYLIVERNKIFPQANLNERKNRNIFSLKALISVIFKFLKKLISSR
jgi:hypothetical protein